MKYIVTNARGEPWKLGGFLFAVEAVAVPTSLEDASRFESVPAAELEAKRMLNLNGFPCGPCCRSTSNDYEQRTRVRTLRSLHGEV